MNKAFRTDKYESYLADNCLRCHVLGEVLCKMVVEVKDGFVVRRVGDDRHDVHGWMETTCTYACDFLMGTS